VIEAQTLVEYGALSGLVSAFQTAFDTIAGTLRDLSPTGWIVVVVVAVVGLLWLRRR
jgi:hypothetical protein